MYQKLTPLKYRPDVDGLRALAIVPVMLFHADLGCSGGFVGVDIFFVISGFLITALILKEIRDGTFSMVTFLERRVRRIFPALVGVIIFTLVAGWFLYLPHDFMIIGKSVLAQVILMSNVFFCRHTGYFGTSADTYPLLHTWSLAVEEQFYVFFPLLLIFLTRDSRFSIRKIVICLAFVSLVLSVGGSYYKPRETFYLLPTRGWELLLGAFLAASTGMRVSVQWLKEAISFSGLGLILYSVLFYNNETRFPGLAAIPPCLGSALIIFSGDTKPTLVGRALAARPIVFIGLISYSLYLWHWPILVFSKYTITGDTGGTLNWEFRITLLVASVAMAILSWRFIETPFRRRLLCPRRPQVFFLAGFSMLALLVFGGGVYLKDGIPSRFSPQVGKYDTSRANHAFRNSITLQEAVTGQFAELGSQSLHQPIEILIWGDSHAMAVTPALDELCRRFSVRGVQATHSATPPFIGYIPSGGLKKSTPVFSKAIVDFISSRRIKNVIIAARWSRYGTPDFLDAELTATVRAIKDSGAKVYVLKDVPLASFDVPRRAAFTALYDGDVSKLTIPADQHQDATRGFEFAFDHLAKIGATILDSPAYFLNTNGSYDVIRHDNVLYTDDNHLSIEGSKLLVPMFEPLFHSR